MTKIQTVSKYMKGFFLGFLFCADLATAQEPTAKDSITQLDEVILLDKLKVKNATGIIPSDIISAKTFQNYSPIDMVSAINQISGAYILSGALNTNRITIRGVGARTLFGTDKLRLYYKDIPITDGSGFSTIEAFDLENLSQIEVIKGPKGTPFGTNLGGAIILSPKEALGISTNISNNFTLGSFGLIKNNLSFNHNDGRLRLGLQYGHAETDGYRENSNFERDGLLLNTSYQINSKNEITILLNHIDYTAQIPSSLGATAFSEDPRQAAFTWKASKGYETNNYTLLGLNYTHSFNKSIKNATSIFYTYLDHYEARPFGILDEYTNGYGFRTRFWGNLGFLNTSPRYAVGFEFYKDEFTWGEFENLYQENNGNGSLQGDKFSQNKEFRRSSNTFGTLLFPLTDAFSAQVGLNVNKTQYDFRDLFNTGAENKSAGRNFKTILLPGLDLNYVFSEKHQIYANVSRGFSNPTLEETLTPEGIINRDIEQETGTNYELGATLFLNDKKLRLNLALYQMNIKNLLVAERVGDDQFVGKNAGKTRHRGIEIEMNYQWDITPRIQLNPFVSYTLSDHSFVEFVDGDEDYAGNPLTGVPKQRRTAGIQSHLFDNFYLNIVHQHVSAIPLTDANSLSSEPFTVFTARMGYGKKISANFTLGVDLGINNLFDTIYARSVLINTQAFGSTEPRYYYPGDSRNYYGSLRLGYQL